MPVVLIEVVVILLLLSANGVFAMAEIAMVTARRGTLQRSAEGGDAGAARAIELIADPTRFLSTVQIGITLIGIFAGAFGGATLAAPVAGVLATIGWLAPISQQLALTLVVATITVASVVIGELVPKRIALAFPEFIAARTARPMARLSTISLPVVALLEGTTDLLLKILRVPNTTERPVTEDELAYLVRQAARTGVLERGEQELVERVFRFGDLQVGALMTARPDIVWLDLHDSPEAVLAKTARQRHSRYLVADGNLDRIAGMVETVDLWVAHARGERLDLQALLRRPHLVPETMDALDALDLFRDSGVHLAVVLDEHGGAEGLVTLTALLRAIVGSRTSADAPSLVQRDDGSYLSDGSLPLQAFVEGLGLDAEPWLAEARHAYHTVAGLVVSRLGRVPKPGDRVTHRGLQLEVMDMDGHRVDKVLAVRVHGAEERR